MLTLVCALLCVARVSAQWIGAGTVADPYRIDGNDALVALATNVNRGVTYAGMYFRLESDIDLALYSVSNSGFNAGKGWVPVGRFGNPFRGSFDGNNKTVRNMFINDPGLNGAGLFGYIVAGTVINLRMENASVTGGDRTGGVAGSVDNSGVVKNCTVAGAVAGVGEVGGVVGYLANGAGIENCYASCSVAGTREVGGVVGNVNVNATVAKCCATGTVTGTTPGERTGGVAGHVHNGGTVTKCYATGAVAGSKQVGGLVGHVNNGNVKNCYATGAVAGSEQVGGIVGNNAGNIANCAALNLSVITTGGTADVGRVAGGNSASLVANVAFAGILDKNNATTWNNGGANAKDGDPKSADDLFAFVLAAIFSAADGWTNAPGAFPGLNGATGIPPFHILAARTGVSPFDAGNGSQAAHFLIRYPEQLAWLAAQVNAGRNQSGVFYKLANDLDLARYNASNSDFNGGAGWIPVGDNGNPFKGSLDGNDKVIRNLFIDNPARDYAGLFGCIDGGTVSKLRLEAAVITGNDFVGGLTGDVKNGGNISDCFVGGTVAGADNVGGVAGSVVLGSSLTGCRFAGDVTGTSGSIGGVVGMLHANKLANCYASGTVTGTDYVGGLAGDIYDGILANSYATCAVAGVNRVGGVAGHISGTGKIEKCAALNPSVIADTAAGRIAGSSGAGVLASNIAFAGISAGNGVAFSNAATATGLDGVSLSAADILTDGSLGNRFAGSAWTTAAGTLPGFGATVGMPAHITAALFAGGTGTQNDEYLIATVDHLRNLAVMVNAGDAAYNAARYKLVANLAFSAADYGSGAAGFNSGKGWVPVGTAAAPFRGDFNGNGKTIRNLYIDDPARDYAGLFGSADGGNIYSVGMEALRSDNTHAEVYTAIYIV